MAEAGFLHSCPRAWEWTRTHQLSEDAINVFAKILKTAVDKGKLIDISQVRKQEIIDDWSFGTTYRTIYKEKVCFWKIIGQVVFFCQWLCFVY